MYNALEWAVLVLIGLLICIFFIWGNYKWLKMYKYMD
jgi:hypothetical protein